MQSEVSQAFLKCYSALVKAGTHQIIESVNKQRNELQPVLPSAALVWEEAMSESQKETAT